MKKVLILEDQDSLRRMLTRHLRACDFQTRSAGNGAEGLNICREWTPDLVLTDIFMPEQDGLETLRALRNVLPGVPVVAMSAGGEFGEFGMLSVARKMGAVRILAKPFALQELTDTLHEALAEASAAKQDGE